MAAAIKNIYDSVEIYLHEKNKFTDVLEILEKKTNVSRLHIVVILGSFVGLFLMCGTGCGANFVANLIGFLYPAYKSVLAIESLDKDVDTMWLTYWVVYSVFTQMEFFTDIFLWWIPFYYFLKVVFLVYCMLPGQYNGSIMIYKYIIRPFLQKYKSKIDQVVDNVSDKVTDVLEDVQDAAVDHITNGIANGITKTDSDC